MTKMPCFGSRCKGCGWNYPDRRNEEKKCQDYRIGRVWVDIKPREYRLIDGVYKRVWRFE